MVHIALESELHLYSMCHTSIQPRCLSDTTEPVVSEAVLEQYQHPSFWNEWSSHSCAGTVISLQTGRSCVVARRLTAAAELQLYVLQSHWGSGVSYHHHPVYSPTGNVLVSPISVPEIHCGLLFVFNFSVLWAKWKYSSGGAQQNSKDRCMCRLKIRGRGFLV